MSPGLRSSDILRRGVQASAFPPLAKMIHENIRPDVREQHPGIDEFLAEGESVTPELKELRSEVKLSYADVFQPISTNKAIDHKIYFVDYIDDRVIRAIDTNNFTVYHFDLKDGKFLDTSIESIRVLYHQLGGVVEKRALQVGQWIDVWLELEIPGSITGQIIFIEYDRITLQIWNRSDKEESPIIFIDFAYKGMPLTPRMTLKLREKPKTFYEMVTIGEGTEMQHIHESAHLDASSIVSTLHEEYDIDNPMGFLENAILDGRNEVDFFSTLKMTESNDSSDLENHSTNSCMYSFHTKLYSLLDALSFINDPEKLIILQRMQQVFTSNVEQKSHTNLKNQFSEGIEIQANDFSSHDKVKIFHQLETQYMNNVHSFHKTQYFIDSLLPSSPTTTKQLLAKQWSQHEGTHMEEHRSVAKIIDEYHRTLQAYKSYSFKVNELSTPIEPLEMKTWIDNRQRMLTQVEGMSITPESKKMDITTIHQLFPQSIESFLSSSEYLSHIQHQHIYHLLIQLLRLDLLYLEIDPKFVDNVLFTSYDAFKILAKTYQSIDEMNQDKGDEDGNLYHDKDLDHTPYHMLQLVKKENPDEEVTKDELVHFILQKEYCTEKEDANTLAATIIQGKRMVVDGEYAMIDVTKQKEDNNNDDIPKFYIRHKNSWVLDNIVTKLNFHSDKDVYCQSKSKQNGEEIKNQYVQEFRTRLEQRDAKSRIELTKHILKYLIFLKSYFVVKEISQMKQNDFSYHLGKISPDKKEFKMSPDLHRPLANMSRSEQREDIGKENVKKHKFISPHSKLLSLILSLRQPSAFRGASESNRGIWEGESLEIRMTRTSLPNEERGMREGGMWEEEVGGMRKDEVRTHPDFARRSSAPELNRPQSDFWSKRSGAPESKREDDKSYYHMLCNFVECGKYVRRAVTSVIHENNKLDENPEWLYCIETHTPLLPRFEYDCAKVFVSGGYDTLQSHIAKLVQKKYFVMLDDIIVHIPSGWEVCKHIFARDAGGQSPNACQVQTHSDFLRGSGAPELQERSSGAKVNPQKLQSHINLTIKTTIISILSKLVSEIGINQKEIKHIHDVVVQYAGMLIQKMVPKYLFLQEATIRDHKERSQNNPELRNQKQDRIYEDKEKGGKGDMSPEILDGTRDVGGQHKPMRWDSDASHLRHLANSRGDIVYKRYYSTAFITSVSAALFVMLQTTSNTIILEGFPYTSEDNMKGIHDFISILKSLKSKFGRIKYSHKLHTVMTPTEMWYYMSLNNALEELKGHVMTLVSASEIQNLYKLKRISATKQTAKSISSNKLWAQFLPICNKSANIIDTPSVTFYNEYLSQMRLGHRFQEHSYGLYVGKLGILSSSIVNGVNKKMKYVASEGGMREDGPDIQSLKQNLHHFVEIVKILQTVQNYQQSVLLSIQPSKLDTSFVDGNTKTQNAHTKMIHLSAIIHYLDRQELPMYTMDIMSEYDPLWPIDKKISFIKTHKLMSKFEQLYTINIRKQTTEKQSSGYQISDVLSKEPPEQQSHLTNLISQYSYLQEPTGTFIDNFTDKAIQTIFTLSTGDKSELMQYLLDHNGSFRFHSLKFHLKTEDHSLSGKIYNVLHSTSRHASGLPSAFLQNENGICEGTEMRSHIYHMIDSISKQTLSEQNLPHSNFSRTYDGGAKLHSQKVQNVQKASLVSGKSILRRGVQDNTFPPLMESQQHGLMNDFIRNSIINLTTIYPHSIQNNHVKHFCIRLEDTASKELEDEIRQHAIAPWINKEHSEYKQSKLENWKTFILSFLTYYDDMLRQLSVSDDQPPIKFRSGWLGTQTVESDEKIHIAPSENRILEELYRFAWLSTLWIMLQGEEDETFCWNIPIRSDEMHSSMDAIHQRRIEYILSFLQIEYQRKEILCMNI